MELAPSPPHRGSTQPTDGQLAAVSAHASQMSLIMAELGKFRSQMADCQREQELATERTVRLEAENADLRHRLAACQQEIGEFTVRSRELENECQSWRHRWEETQDAMQQVMNDHEALGDLLKVSSMPAPATPQDASVASVSGSASGSRTSLAPVQQAMQKAMPEGVPEGVPECFADAVQQIHRHGWHSVAWDRGYTLLHWAARRDRDDLCSYFLTQGADAEECDDSGRCPLDIARERGNSAALRTLEAAAAAPKSSKLSAASPDSPTSSLAEDSELRSRRSAYGSECWEGGRASGAEEFLLRSTRSTKATSDAAAAPRHGPREQSQGLVLDLLSERTPAAAAEHSRA